MNSQFFDSRPMFLFDYTSYEILDVSDRAVDIYGFSKDEFKQMKITDLGDLIEAERGVLLKTGPADPELTWNHKNKAGDQFLVRFTSHQINGQKRPVRLAVAHEVDSEEESTPRFKKPFLSRKLNETTDNFKMSVESYRALFDAIGDAICLYDKNGRFIEVNDGAADMYGYAKTDFVGMYMNMLSAPGKVDMQGIKDRFSKAIKGDTQRFEFWGRRKNGEVFPQEIVFNPGYYFGQKVVISIARDITEQYQRELKIKKSEEMFRQLFKNSPIGIALLDDHKEIMLVNEGFEEIFGFEQQEVVGLDIDQVLLSEEADQRSPLLVNKKNMEVSTRIKRKDGKTVDVLVYGVPVIVEGKTISIYGIYVDITDRKRAEEKVKRSLKEKEVLLAEIHHRVKNNLAVITGLLELQRENSTSDDAKATLKDSQLRINSMALIHEKLYQSENLSQIQFDNYIRELVGVIGRSHLVGKQVEIRIDAEPINLTIKQAIPCGLLLNEIVTNALKHAFPNGREGEIVISFKMNGEQLHFEIRDNGIGLPDDFETIKFRSLGVTLINTLSKQLGARLMVFSETGTAYSLLFDYEK